MKIKNGKRVCLKCGKQLSIMEECGSTMVSVQDLELEEYKPYPTQPADDTIEIEGKKYSIAEIKEKLK